MSLQRARLRSFYQPVVLNSSHTTAQSSVCVREDAWVAFRNYRTKRPVDYRLSAASMLYDFKIRSKAGFFLLPRLLVLPPFIFMGGEKADKGE